jgi:predicted lipid-binding transport protein (Tim44 family)
VVELPSSTIEPGRARQAVADVLSRAEYAEAEPGLWARIEGEIARLLGELWMRLVGTGAGTLIGNVVLVLLVAAIAFAAWRLVRSLRRDATQEEPLAADVGRSAASWLEEAATHEESARWREAVRCRYRALIADLAADGRLQEIPGRTAGEYLAAVRRDLPAASEPFARATRIFESAWYGPDEVTAEDAAALRGAAAQVVPAGAVTGGGR